MNLHTYSSFSSRSYSAPAAAETEFMLCLMPSVMRQAALPAARRRQDRHTSYSKLKTLEHLDSLRGHQHSKVCSSRTVRLLIVSLSESQSPRCLQVLQVNLTSAHPRHVSTCSLQSVCMYSMVLRVSILCTALMYELQLRLLKVVILWCDSSEPHKSVAKWVEWIHSLSAPWLRTLICSSL